MGFKDLEARIKEQAQKYYQDGSQEVSDEEFDGMVDELRHTNPDSELLRTGWGYDINLDDTPGEKVKHKYGEAGSLDKCRIFNEINKSIRNRRIFASLKLDGISVVLYYQKGKLVQALTRGDGYIGIDITAKVRKILREQEILDSRFTGAVRGEILMPIKNFEPFKELHPEAKNCRNSTAGLINSNGEPDDLKFLEIKVYTVVGLESGDISCLCMEDIVFWLQGQFSNVAPYSTIELNDNNFLETLTNLKDKWYGKVPADGIVITNPSLDYNIDTGCIQYDAQAFKFPSEIKETEIVNIEWNMSKTRYAIPRIQVKPVQLAGTTVEFCTGYNAQYIVENNLGYGSIVKVEKRGEIIPNIVEVVRSTQCEIPKHCPVCDSELEWNGVHLQCDNIYCGNASQQDLLIWLQTLAPIDGLGDLIKLKFLEEIFGKDLTIERVMESPKMYLTKGLSGHKKLVYDMFNQLYFGKFTLKDALLSLNVPRFGDKTCEKLSQYPDIVKQLIDLALDHVEEIGMDIMTKLQLSIGNANAVSVENNLEKFKRLQFIRHQIDWISNPSKVESKGKVAITGKLSLPRADFEKQLKLCGYTVGEISKDTTFLITDNPNGSSSKNKKADALGIVKISESEFRANYM